MAKDRTGPHPDAVQIQYFCPVTGRAVFSGPQWQDRQLGPDYAATFAWIGNYVLHSAPAGAMGHKEMAAGLDLLRDAIDQIPGGDGRFILIENLHGIKAMTRRARLDFIEFCLDQDHLSGLLFYNASAWIKIAINIGKRFNSRNLNIHITESYIDAIHSAATLGAGIGLDAGPQLFTPIPSALDPQQSFRPVSRRFSPDWDIRSKGFQNRSVLIDDTIMVSESRGKMEPEAIDMVHNLRRDLRRNVPPGASLDYIILDATDLEGGNRRARKLYMQNLIEWHNRYPLKMFVAVGVNSFMRTAIAMAKPFIPFRVATAETMNDAFSLVQCNRDETASVACSAARASSQHPRVWPDIDQLMAHIGTIDWEVKGIERQSPFPETHPLQPVAQAIHLIKGELDELFEEREAARKAQEASDRKYRELFEKGSDWLCVHDLDGIFIETNLAYKAVLGPDSGRAVPRTLWELIPKRYHTELDGYLSRIKQQGHDKGILNINAADGGERVLEYRSALVPDESGELARVKSWGRDITMEIKASKEKERLQKKLQQSQKMESIGTLAGGIAHDFNNILSSVIGFTELAVEDAGQNPQLQDNLQEVLKAGLRAKELVHQILTFARQTDEDRSPIQVSLIAKEIVKMLRSTTPANIDIKHRITSDAMILGNPTQVQQIVLNLCTNACQSMEDGGGFLDIGLETVSIPAQHEFFTRDLAPGDYLKLTVSDTGHGIAPDIIDHIFEPYFSTKPPDQGTGMGLAIVHGIVSSYGGDVGVQSSPGSGSVFTVLIPILPARHAEAELNDNTARTGDEAILFIDDEYPILKSVARILGGLGYSVTCTSSSTEALALFESAPDQFDLVITDMTMPELTGDRLAEHMLRIRPDLPIIMCTGFNKNISERRARAIGIKSLIYKPLGKVKLSEVIRSVLD